ncbi:uncharacterized protein LOC125033229 [Penaeus chinensis]|uniref:uncharacterized protein LOC125033229 n=1 Tax=Penaeus chinensis TaxID=139456 RepID=UPI001FB671B3|nr:uncharacterized protein LOC125033229 [Penaeus chinensis]
MILLGTKRIQTTAYHPSANGMLERLHRQLKEALTASSSTRQWVDQLPLALLHIQTSFKQDLQCTAAEMVYGTTIALPADFVVSSGSQDPGAFGKQLRNRMARIRSRPTRPSRQRDIYLPRDLHDCSHIFIRRPTKPPLCPPYEGPFPVVKRDGKTITIRRPRGEDIVCIDRAKPAHLQEPCTVSRVPADYRQSPLSSPDLTSE